MNQNRDLPYQHRCGCGTHTDRAGGETLSGCCCNISGENTSAPKHRGFGIPNGVLAALYIPQQCFDGLYDNDTAFNRGTLFRALDKPFLGGKEGGCRGQQR